MFHNLGHDAGDPVAHFRDARIEHEAIAGGANPLRVQDVYAGGNLRQRAVQFGDGFRTRINRDAIGVKPGMNAHAALMGFIQHQLEWIVARILTDFAGQHIGPRQNLRWPERGAIRFHLEEDGVNAEAF